MVGFGAILTDLVKGEVMSSIEQTNMVFVYGTLKHGFYNHRVMLKANGRFVGAHITEPEYTMVSLRAYPAVLDQGDTSIHGEVYEVDSLLYLDRLEGYPGFYDRKIIDTSFGPAWMYLLADRHKDVTMYPKVPTGKW